MSFPTQRPRRLRGNPTLRRLARETRIAPQDLIYPLFVRDAIEQPQPIESMPGQVQHTLESLTREAETALKLGVRSLVLFGIPGGKDPQGSGAWIDDGIVQRALRQLRDAFGSDALLIADLCLCEYTDHGHCGVLDGERVDNDRTLEIYQRIATSQAAAGADVIAPSGMMDGQVAAIRSALDQAGFTDRLRRQVRIGVLWAVPRGRRLRTTLRRPARLPNGCRKRARGRQGGPDRCRRRCGHGHGEARPGVPRRDSCGRRVD